MQLFFLSTLTMVAFAANSVLNKLAVDGGDIDPASFATIRVLSGAVMLLLLVRLQGRKLVFLTPRRFIGAGSLILYMIGFSAAYLTLDAGLGALVLFGVVQITMLLISAARGAPPTPGQAVGALVAFSGLAWALWPSGPVSVDATGAGLMVLAGIGWGVYTLAGREEPDALAGTAANFCLALPLVVLISLAGSSPLAFSFAGIALAVLSGAVTSGLGYALWYSILPRFSPSMAAIVQLSAPVIALIAGVVLLGEATSIRLLAGAALVLGGIALAALSGRKSGVAK